MKAIICFTSCLNPFDLTQEIIEKLAGIKVSTSVKQKVTKQIGSNYGKLSYLDNFETTG